MAIAKKFLCGLWLVISPFGLSCAVKHWSTLTALVFGVAVALVQVGLFIGFTFAPVGEPYPSFENCVLGAFQTCLGASFCIGPILAICMIPCLRVVANADDSRGYRMFLLGHVPFLLPWIGWLICGLAVNARDPGFDIGVPKPNWIYSDVVGTLGADWVGITLLSAGVAVSLWGLWLHYTERRKAATA